jgi:hypothetical protein
LTFGLVKSKYETGDKLAIIEIIYDVNNDKDRINKMTESLTSEFGEMTVSKYFKLHKIYDRIPCKIDIKIFKSVKAARK